MCLDIMSHNNTNYSDILIPAIIFSCAYMLLSEVWLMIEAEMSNHETYELTLFKPLLIKIKYLVNEFYLHGGYW